MSYCRSSDESDVYVYATRRPDGAWEWVVHVANGRLNPDQPEVGPQSTPDELVAALGFPLVPVGDLDGRMFYEQSPEGCADRLEVLRAHGYLVPQRAIDRLRAEAASAGEAQPSI